MYRLQRLLYKIVLSSSLCVVGQVVNWAFAAFLFNLSDFGVLLGPVSSYLPVAARFSCCFGGTRGFSVWCAYKKCVGS